MMKKIFLMMFISLMLLCEATINEGMAQQEPPIKAGLTLDKEWYNLGEAIQAKLTLTNSDPTPIITSKGFADSYFHLYLVFTDPEGKVITSDQLQNIRPFSPPPPRAIKLQGGWGQAEPIEFLEINNNDEGKWCLTMSFKIQDYYSPDSFSKVGKYSVKAMVPMRTYLNYESIADVYYADIKSEKWKGFIESNIEHFTISGEAPGRIDVLAELNKVTGRRTKKTPIVGMTVRIYDKTSFCVLQYGINWQNYSPDIWGNCSSLASGVTDQYGKVSFPLQAWDYIVIGHYGAYLPNYFEPEEFPGLSAGGLESGMIMNKYLLVIR